MKHLNESILNEATNTYYVQYLMVDYNAYYEFNQGDIDASEVEMYENDEIDRDKIKAPNDDAVIKKVQKIIDKYSEPLECCAASIYDNDPDKDGKIVATIFTKTWADLQ